jgi:hypothetical protein
MCAEGVCTHRMIAYTDSSDWPELHSDVAKDSLLMFAVADVYSVLV